jgi:hypothetical protein
MAAILPRPRPDAGGRCGAGKLAGDFQEIARFKLTPRTPPQTRIARIGHAMDQRQILPRDRMVFELRGQPLMRAVGFRHDQQARCVLVDPVHNAGPLFAANTRQAVAAMVQQRIYQRLSGLPGAGCTTMPAGLSMTIRSSSS